MEILDKALKTQVIDKEHQQSIENDESWGWDSYAFSVKVTPTEANREMKQESGFLLNLDR